MNDFLDKLEAIFFISDHQPEPWFFYATVITATAFALGFIWLRRRVSLMEQLSSSFNPGPGFRLTGDEFYYMMHIVNLPPKDKQRNAYIKALKAATKEFNSQHNRDYKVSASNIK